jgi:hypothetical protein
MAQEINTVYKRYMLTVNNPVQSYPVTFELDRNIKLVKGLQMSADLPNLIFYRGSQRIELNGNEIFPDGYESRQLMSGVSVPPDQKYKDIGGVLAGNGELKLTFKDSDNAVQPFQPYVVSIYLLCVLN